MTIATTIILGFLFSSNPTFVVPDLCDVVNPDTGTPTICQPHGPDPSVLDRDVCCKGDECVQQQSGESCSADELLFHCDYGKVDQYGNVTCFFEVPDYCDVHVCEAGGNPGYSMGPQSDFICCWFGDCYQVPLQYADTCGGDIFWCGSPYTNADGTVGCADDE